MPVGRRIAWLFALTAFGAALVFALQSLRQHAPAPASESASERSEAIDRPATRGSMATTSAPGDDGHSPVQEDRPRPSADADPFPDSVDARFAAAYGEPSPALVRASLERALAEVFVDRRLSNEEIERATMALVRLRTLRNQLAELPMEPEYAERRRALVEALGLADETFREVMAMSPAEFTARVAAAGGEPAAIDDGGGGGIDHGVDPDYVPDDDFLPPREQRRSTP